MGNQLQHVGLKLDKAHRGSYVGCNDLNGSTDLEGGRRVKADRRINDRISSFKNFKRDVLEAAAFSAVASDIVGFRLEFEIIGGSSVFWAMPRMTYVKVTQVFEHADAPPRLTSVRGFYVLFFMLKDLWDSESFAKEMAKADGASAASTKACATVKVLDCEDAAEGSRCSASNSDAKTLCDSGQNVQLAKASNASAYDDVDDRECPICMDARIAVAPPCGHGICRNCYEEWRQHSSACPTCRGDGAGSELWIELGQDKIPDGSEHVDDLMQAIHTYVQMLPRLETRWEKQQRAMRQQAMRSRSSTVSTTASNSSLIGDAAVLANAEASLQRMLAEAGLDVDGHDDDIYSSYGARRSVYQTRAWLATVNESTLRRLDVSQLDEELQVEVAMRLSLAA
mmetsp:Transcript_21463/g.42156  ORF Transcript_21463/g.42156 Transcript_21463/m.42156 type:complete len:396 (-) Transcript_21463:283-1470(-)|eukprot:CAMPEP_0171504716 /NCGR_PEP_ID=MMETSP0958-20121227/11755_1 /TAXON_ID=87120 /ORGANISM="Aurantiochytrium limacinum, Strain ATCCMYA-1381" /LENGTH=395 /DNA_ID=CAMNT_0012040647 /DNA_START=449 /DNA_END=1636 /DNA_ORIENTATION=+